MKTSDDQGAQVSLVSDLRTSKRIAQVRRAASKQKEKPKRDLAIPLRVTADEKAEIQKKADQYCNGNMSEWIRFASIILEP